GKPKVDINNPDAINRTHPLIGLNMLLGFEHSGGNKWEKGTIYDPESGKTYSCKIELINATTINIRGYIGISLIGRSDTWKKVSG
ncbi:MAG: DUF2147 domain-containing protein, partial [Bacteroidia bacterium]|nr:DUF2147 domain-containing protein [Bacteroidia bacterium]